MRTAEFRALLVTRQRRHSRRLLDSSEAHKHLFEGRLTDRVVVDVEVDLDPFHRPENDRPRGTDRVDMEVDETLVPVLKRTAGKTLREVVDEAPDSFEDRRLVADRRHLDDDRVATAELRLQVLRAAQTLETTVDHDRQTSAQRLTLFHTAMYNISQRTINKSSFATTCIFLQRYLTVPPFVPDSITLLYDDDNNYVPRFLHRYSNSIVKFYFYIHFVNVLITDHHNYIRLFVQSDITHLITIKLSN